jgi:hypothetical protein
VVTVSSTENGQSGDIREVSEMLRTAMFKLAASKLPTLYRATVHKSPLGAAIAFAGPVYAGDKDPGVRVVATPGVSCTASAAIGSRVVVLGTAPMNAKGTALVAKRVVGTLMPGHWIVTAKCGSAIATRAIVVHA